MTDASISQDLTEHQWKDRLILILTPDTTKSLYKKQLKELYSDPEGLEDRRLVIYKVLPNEFLRDDRPDESWQESEALYQEYKRDEGEFEILLIGLDGGVKLRQNTFISKEKLFARIDQMPMRQRELRQRGER